MPSTTEIHEWIANYDWDDGLAPIGPIVDDAKTEFATALLIYWRLGGPWLEGDASRVNHDAVKLQRLVRERLLRGYYPRIRLRYYPVEDNRLSKVQVAKLKRSGCPLDLLEPQYPAEPAEE